MKNTVAKLSLSLIFAVAFALGGCVKPPSSGLPQVPPSGEQPPAADVLGASGGPLTGFQVQQVLECQEAIKYQGAEFASFKEQQLDACLDETLAVQLGFENGQINSTQYNQALASIRNDCTRRFKQIGAASTILVNAIISACQPVQSLVLPSSGYDPLQLETAFITLENTPVSDVGGLAGRICGAKELLVDASVGFQVPRMVTLLTILDQGTGQFAVSGPTSMVLPVPTTIPNIPLDSRCVLPTLP